MGRWVVREAGGSEILPNEPLHWIGGGAHLCLRERECVFGMGWSQRITDIPVKRSGFHNHSHLLSFTIPLFLMLTVV